MVYEFKYYTDPGHGWMMTPVKLLEKYKVQDKISKYSYIDGDTAFLEEDCDATVLLNAIEAAGDTAAFLVDMHTDEDSFIRELQSYNYGGAHAR
jgi:hypothetical protein